MPAVPENKQVFHPSHPSLIGRVLPIFRQTMNGPETSEMDIKTSILALTVYLQANEMYEP